MCNMFGLGRGSIIIAYAWVLDERAPKLKYQKTLVLKAPCCSYSMGRVKMSLRVV